MVEGVVKAEEDKGGEKGDELATNDDEREVFSDSERFGMGGRKFESGEI